MRPQMLIHDCEWRIPAVCECIGVYVLIAPAEAASIMIIKHEYYSPTVGAKVGDYLRLHSRTHIHICTLAFIRVASAWSKFLTYAKCMALIAG